MEYYNRYINVTQLTEIDTIYDKSLNSKISLKPHQLILLKKCLEREQKYIYDFESSKYESLYTDVGIIGDKVGSGKSYVILSLILQNIEPPVNESISVAYGIGSHFSLKQIQNEYIDKKVNIIVISHLLVKQWCKYVDDFCPDLRYICINNKKALLSLENVVNDNELIICTGFMYKQLRAIFYLNNWRCTRIFFDEIDTTNTPGANYLPSKFVWFVSASYKNIMFPLEKAFQSRINVSHILSNGIQNNSFAKNLFMSTLKNMGHNELRVVDRIIVKNDDTFVDESLGLPEIIKHIIICKNPIEISVLSGLVNNEIISSLNAGDIQSALSHIHTYNLDSETNIIAKVLNDLETNKTNLEIRKNGLESMIYNNESQKEMLVNKSKLDIMKINTKINEISTRIVDNNLCPICYNDVCPKTISKCCNNSFCLSCITQWLNVQNKCPLCKNISNINDFYIVQPYIDIQKSVIYDSTCHFTSIPSSDNFTRNLDKCSNLERILINRKSYSKYVIFSEFEHGFNAMYPNLEKAQVSFSHLKGNQQQCNYIIEKYKTSDLDVLLINSKHYGSGLNLENTTDIVLFHKFTDQIEKQVIGRAQRTGRKDSLNVWYLLNEQEEHNRENNYIEN